MQLASVMANLMPSPTPAVGGNAAANGDSVSADHASFAQLLGDAGANHPQQKQSADQGQDLPTTQTVALVAQEVAPDASHNAVTMANQTLTLDEITAALEKLSVLDANDPLVAKLTAALKDAQRNGGSESLASLMQKIAVALQPKTPNEQAQLIARTMQILTSVANEHAPEKKHASDASSNSLLQSLQASLFRPVDAQAQPAPTEEKPESRDIVEIIPMNQVVLASAPVTTVATQTIELAREQPNLDTLIPQLTAPKTDVPTHALPEVTLPSAVGVAANDNHAELLNALATTTASADAAKLTSDQVKDGAAALLAALANPQSAANAVVATNHATEGAADNHIPVIGFAAANTPQVPVGQQPAEAAPVVTSNVVMNGTRQAVETPVQTAGVKIAEELVEDAKSDNAAQPVGNILPQPVVPRSAAVAAPVATVHVPMTEQVHVAIARVAKDGVNQVTIQLDPVDLGRVEVNMRTGADGQTQISFMVDKPSTLDSLARGAHGLERSLQEAGVKTDAGNMQFNLRQQPQTSDANTGGQGQRQAFNQPTDDIGIITNTASTAAISAATGTRNYMLNIRDGLDIRA